MPGKIGRFDLLRLPVDLSWIIKNKEGLKWVEAAVINRLTTLIRSIRNLTLKPLQSSV